MPIIKEFVKRGLGEGDIEHVEIVGASFESVRDKFRSAVMAQKKKAKRKAEKC
jgi:hypothetical protein